MKIRTAWSFLEGDIPVNISDETSKRAKMPAVYEDDILLKTDLKIRQLSDTRHTGWTTDGLLLYLTLALIQKFSTRDHIAGAQKGIRGLRMGVQHERNYF